MFTENKISEFQNKISELADRPQMSAQALKAYFDGSAEEIRQKYNALIDELDSFGAASLDSIDYNAAEYKLTFTFKNGSTQVIDLPLELLIESGHYDADTQCIVLTLANGDALTIPVADLIDTYTADEQTLTQKDNTFSVKDGVFATEAPADGALYARKDGNWKEIIEGLPEITLAEADDVLEGVYRVRVGDDVGVLCASTNIVTYEYVDIEGRQTVIWSDGRIQKRTRFDPILDYESVVKNADGSYSLKPDYVFPDPWSEWQSVIPSIAGYAKTSYVDEIANKSKYETILEGELTEGGVSEISVQIPADITQYKQLQFYAKANVAEVESGTNCVHSASICDKNHVAYNSGVLYQTVTHKDKTTYRWDCEANVCQMDDEEYVFWSKFNISSSFGNNSNTTLRTLVTNAKKSNLTSTALPSHLSMRITNTTFEAGTKYCLRGIR